MSGEKLRAAQAGMKENAGARLAPPAPRKLTAGCGRDRMWRAIRVMRRFTRQELASVAGVGSENAKSFLVDLALAGVLSTPRRGSGATWSLVKDPGPGRPSLPSSKRGRGCVDVA